jgi:hypothetical protein
MEEYGLSPDELQEAKEVIRRAHAGVYTLRKLYGSRWLALVSPRDFGGRFKAAVRGGLLAGITVCPEKNSANAVLYEVYER